jgi:putative transposase
MVGRLKSVTTGRYITGVRESGWAPFEERLWQRSYYDHIIRDDDDLNAVREYIANNPVQWAVDAENPERR